MLRILYCALIIMFSITSYAASLSPRTYNKLNEIQLSINEQPSQELRAEIDEKLKELAEDLQGNSLGLALTWQTHAQLMLLDERYSLANGYLSKAIQLDGLDSATMFQLRSFYAQILFIEEKYAKAIEVLKQVIAATDFKESAAIYSLTAAAFYSLNNFNDGLPFIVKAINLSNKPKEAWLQMAFSGFYQQKNLKEALFYTNKLVLNFPDKKDYWQQKSGMHQLIEEYPNAASTKELSFKKGFVVKESDYINLGQLLASQGNAYKVADALQSAFDSGQLEETQKSLRLMQQAWMQAKEIRKAVASLQVLFERFSDINDGIRLMKFLVDEEKWEKALTISEQLYVLELTEKQKGEMLLLQGICHYRIGETRSAFKALSKAMAIDSSSSQAKGWMNYIKQLQES
jgi:tetratricopeptide (TPR) repeat protein